MIKQHNDNFKSHYTIGRDCIRIYVPTCVVRAFAFLLQACILRSGRRYVKRRGSSDIAQNCFTGMGGQLAALYWLRYIGLPVQMVLPSPAPDPGFDLAYGGTDGTGLKIEVKTSCFQDGRGVEALSHGDRMPLRVTAGDRKRAAAGERAEANFYFWLVSQPHPMHAGPRVYFDLIATVPAGVIGGWNKPVSTPPGKRLRDIATLHSPPNFVEAFRDVVDREVARIEEFTDDITPTDAVSWALSHELITVVDGVAQYDDVLRGADELYIQHRKQ